MKVVKKGRYILNAHWHSHHGKEVEVIMKRKGVSKAYEGKMIYHVALDPDEDFRSEDFDEEFIEDNFKPSEELLCVLDITRSTDEIVEKFKHYFAILEKKMLDRINAKFIVHRRGHPPLAMQDYLCIFYLVDNNGKPGLTLDREENGEIIEIENT